MKPKLDKYLEFKDREESNTLACSNLKRYNRSLVSKLVCGILPLEVETGRYARKWDKVKKKYVKIPREERYCTVCNSGKVEDEYHFLFTCVPLQKERSEFYIEHIVDFAWFILLPDSQKVQFLLTKPMIKKFGNLVESLFRRRRQLLYRAS